MAKIHRHHKQPRHLGGSDDPSNIEELGIKDHAELHALRFLEGKDRWFCAMQEVWALLDPRLQQEVRDRMSTHNIMKDPEVAKKANSHPLRVQRQSERMRSQNPMKNPEVAAKVSAAKKGKPSNRKGAVLSPETKEKLRQASLDFWGKKRGS